jgi:hypothetical protein
MLKHIVMFRRKAEVAMDIALESVLVNRMNGLATQIDAIREWRLSENELDRPICWHYVLESGFDDPISLGAYLTHPKHVELVADLKKYFEWAAVDYTD